MIIAEITAKLVKQYDSETDQSEIGATLSVDRNEKNKVVILPMNQIKSQWEGDDKANPEWIEARENIEKIKKQIKRDISKLPPIFVRRLPSKNTYQVIDGHHRYFAFREMNVKHIPTIILSAGQITGDKYTEAIAPHGEPNNTIIDGNHHAIATIISNNPTKYINIYEEE